MNAAKIEGLRKLAKYALDQYDREIRSGGDPIYPQWAGDLIELVDLIGNKTSDKVEA